ncbi:MAG: DMT family transporter [Fimbriimonadaceae bacterium]|nr:DMT family transporter [Fimbriimonadaceae bacterium]
MRWPSICWPLVVTATAWGYNFVSIKLVYRQMEPSALSLIRFLLMWAILVAIGYATRQPPRVSREDRWPTFLAGTVSMGIYMVLFLEGLKRTSSADAAIVLASAPLLTYGFSLLFRLEAFRWAGLLGTVLALVGVAAVTLNGARTGASTWQGNLLVFISAIVWALSTFQMRPLVERYGSLPALTASMPGALPVLAIYGGMATLGTNVRTWDAVTWANLAQITLASGVAAFICFYIGVKQVGPATATRYQFFVPVLATLFAWWVFGQRPNTMQWTGIATVIAGVMLTSWARQTGKSAAPDLAAPDLVEPDLAEPNGNRPISGSAVASALGTEELADA